MKRLPAFHQKPVTPIPENQGESSDADSRGSANGTDERPFLTNGERAYLEIVARDSGREIPQEAFEKKKAEHDLLMAQSIHIADMLESVGVKAYGDSKLTMVGLVSGIEEPMIDFRNIVFLPAVAKRKRNRMLGDLEYFLQKHPFCRMWVFTSGLRCRIEEVAARIKEVHRRLSKLNAKPFMKAANVSIVFRSTELGRLVRVDGEPTFHIHSHAIIFLARKLNKDAWSALLQKVRVWWKFHFKDSKRIQMAREACKYVVKPGDLLNLTALELKALASVLFNLHLVQALGPLRDQRHEREESDQCFHRVLTPMGSLLVTVPNWNTRPGELPASTSLLQPRDSVLATLVPGPYFTRVTEPVAIILNRGKGRLLAQNNRLLRVWRAAQAATTPLPRRPGGALPI